MATKSNLKSVELFNVREYRLSKLRSGKGYIVRACMGLMDVVSINDGYIHKTQQSAREAAIRHAQAAKVRPMIITDTL